MYSWVEDPLILWSCCLFWLIMLIVDVASYSFVNWSICISSPSASNNLIKMLLLFNMPEFQSLINKTFSLSYVWTYSYSPVWLSNKYILNPEEKLNSFWPISDTLSSITVFCSFMDIAFMMRIPPPIYAKLLHIFVFIRTKSNSNSSFFR